MQTLLALCLCFVGADDNQANDRVESAARRFRIHTYNNFRLNRAEYDRRIGHVTQLLGKWEKSHQTEETADDFTEWLVEFQLLAAEEPLPEFSFTGNLALVAEPPAPVDSEENNATDGDSADENEDFDFAPATEDSSGIEGDGVSSFLNPMDRDGDAQHSLIGRLGRVVVRGLFNASTDD